MSLGMKNLGKAASLPLLMTLLAPGAARGQTSMGGVSGTVTDPTGAVVPGATVLLVNQATNVRNERLTNSAGFFTFWSPTSGSIGRIAYQSPFVTVRVASSSLIKLS